MTDKSTSGERGSRLTTGGWVAVLVLFGLLVWALWYATHAWSALGDTQISTAGWIFLALGVLFTLLVGGGLMALLFYSSRKNFDR
jgi:fumarate reductase subunit D